MERHLRRLKDQPYLKAPKTPIEITEAFKDDKVQSDYGYNLSNTEKLYINTVSAENTCFTLFASMDVVKMIETNIPPNQRQYSMDATFRIVPQGNFKQLLIIYIEFHNDVSEYFLDCFVHVHVK